MFYFLSRGSSFEYFLISVLCGSSFRCARDQSEYHLSADWDCRGCDRFRIQHGYYYLHDNRSTSLTLLFLGLFGRWRIYERSVYSGSICDSRGHLHGYSHRRLRSTNCQFHRKVQNHLDSLIRSGGDRRNCFRKWIQPSRYDVHFHFSASRSYDIKHFMHDFWRELEWPIQDCGINEPSTIWLYYYCDS